MEHSYENQIICPYCDWEDKDSWEFTEDEGTHTCGSCEKEFNVTREIEVTYSTTRINCEEQDTKHNYQIESFFESKRKGSWTNLPESQWRYNRIDMCQNCGDKTYTNLSEEAYFQQKEAYLKSSV